jgi:hypothetical protein
MASLQCRLSVDTVPPGECTKEASSEMIETITQAQESGVAMEGAWASAKKNPKVIFYSVAACVSSMLWGFDIGTGLLSYTSTISDTDVLTI